MEVAQRISSREGRVDALVLLDRVAPDPRAVAVVEQLLPGNTTLHFLRVVPWARPRTPGSPHLTGRCVPGASPPRPRRDCSTNPAFSLVLASDDMAGTALRVCRELGCALLAATGPAEPRDVRRWSRTVLPSLVQASPAPVCCVPSVAGPRRTDLRRILVVAHPRLPILHLYDLIHPLVTRTRAEVILLTPLSGLESKPDPDVFRFPITGPDSVSWLVRDLERDCRVRLVDAGHCTPKSVLEQAERLDVDVIAMGADQAGMVSGWRRKTFLEVLAARSTRPLLFNRAT